MVNFFDGRFLQVEHVRLSRSGISLRVPVATGSVVDLTVNLATEVTAEEINEAIRIAATQKLVVRRMSKASIATST